MVLVDIIDTLIFINVNNPFFEDSFFRGQIVVANCSTIFFYFRLKPNMIGTVVAILENYDNNVLLQFNLSQKRFYENITVSKQDYLPFLYRTNIFQNDKNVFNLLF